MNIEIQIAILGLLIAFVTFYRTRDKDVKTEATELAVIKTTLNNISSGIDSIRIDNKANEKRLMELNEKVIRVEESSKQAHKRIDSLENKKGVDRDE